MAYEQTLTSTCRVFTCSAACTPYVLQTTSLNAVHDAAVQMNIGTFFQADLYQNSDWQKEYGTSNEDTEQVHALPACMGCRSYWVFFYVMWNFALVQRLRY